MAFHSLDACSNQSVLESAIAVTATTKTRIWEAVKCPWQTNFKLNSTENFHSDQGSIGMSHISVTPLGAGQDVGRSCLLVSIGGKHIMLDCGMHMGYNDDRRQEDPGSLSVPSQEL